MRLKGGKVLLDVTPVDDINEEPEINISKELYNNIIDKGLILKFAFRDSDNNRYIFTKEIIFNLFDETLKTYECELLTRKMNGGQQTFRVLLNEEVLSIFIKV